jgi:hypothetical protein
MARESPGRIVAPRLADALCALAESQLQIQASQSAALDGGAFGMMGVDAAIAAITVGVKSASHLWIASLILLGLSFGLAVRALLRRGAKQIGPFAIDMLNARDTYDDDQLAQRLLRDLATDVLANQWALSRKAPLLTGALALMALAVLCELAVLVF